MRLLAAIERGKDFRELEAPARRVARLRAACRRDRLRCIAAHDITTCEHAQRGQVLGFELQRALRVPLSPLTVVGSERQLTKQDEGVRTARARLERATHGGEYRRRIGFLEQQRGELAHALRGTL